MINIALISAGQLGGRHLQGLSTLDEPASIYVVDPDTSALKRAQVRWDEVVINKDQHRLVLLENIAALPPTIDLAIIASTARVRFQILSMLANSSRVRALILEKVLFSNPVEYEYAAKLLELHNIPTWVNHPRRLYSCYTEIKKFIEGEEIVEMTINGGNWGLGCNAVHFADLFAFLSGRVIGKFSTAQLDPTSYESKRPGYVEFGGALIGTAMGSKMVLSDDRRTGRHLITVRCATKALIVDEVGGRVSLLDERDGWRDASFVVPYQSALTGKVAREILQHQTSVLPDYNTSMTVHLPVIEALNAHYRSYTDSQAISCPIT